MNHYLLFFALSVFALQLPAQVIPYQELSRPSSKPGTDTYLYYSSPRDEIVVKDGQLSHFSKNYHHGAGEVSLQSVAEGVPLNGRQLLALKDMINSSGLAQLDRRAYGALDGGPETESVLRVRVDGREQAVLFRSGPGHSSPPTPFSQISQHLWQLVTEVEQ